MFIVSKMNNYKQWKEWESMLGIKLIFMILSLLGTLLFFTIASSFHVIMLFFKSIRLRATIKVRHNKITSNNKNG